jgi:inner membrane protein
MDPPTHGLMGAVIAQAFFSRTLGRRALGWGAALSMLPDIDVAVIPVLGGLSEWRYHRTATHALTALPVAAACIGWALWRRTGRGSARQWILLAAAALLAHPIADAFTSYGTVLFWPSPARYAWDAVPIVDVIFSGALVLALVLGRLWRARPGAAAAAGGAALAFLAAYEAYGLHLNRRAESEARRQLEAAGRKARDVHAYPVLFLPWLRRVVAEEGPGYSVGWVSTWRPGAIEWYTLHSADGPPVDAARRLDDVRVFEWFAMGRTRYAVEEHGGEVWVEAYDLRYGFPHEPQRGLWGVRARLDRSGEPAGAVRRIQVPRPPLGASLRWLWRATFGGDVRVVDAAPTMRGPERRRGGRRG